MNDEALVTNHFTIIRRFIMTRLFVKSTIVGVSLLFAGYSYECPLNAKLDEQLCSKLSTNAADNFSKFNIILKTPVIEIPDTLKNESAEEFSKYYQDSLSRYLDANKEIIQSIATDNDLYTVTSSEDALERLTKDNMSIDFKISAAATVQTILILAENYSIISKLEIYEEFGPTAVAEENKTFGQKNTETSAFLILNGKKIGLQMSSGTIVKNVTIYDLHGRTVKTFVSQGQYGSNILTTSLPQSNYILSVKNDLGQINNNVIAIP
jgi:hypothetical protein